MDADKAKQLMTTDHRAGLKEVCFALMESENDEVAQLLGSLLAGEDESLYQAAAGAGAEPDFPVEIATLFDALCVAGYVDTAASSLIGLLREAKKPEGDPRRRAFEAIILDRGGDGDPAQFIRDLEQGRLVPRLFGGELPVELRRILAQAVNPRVGYVTPGHVEERLHDYLGQWATEYKNSYGSWEISAGGVMDFV